jgi:hypothetical protein
VKATELLSVAASASALEKVGRSLATGRSTLLRSGAAAGAALVALSAASAATSAIRHRTESR